MGGDAEQPLLLQPHNSPPDDASSKRRKSGPRRRIFPTGTAVEVRTNEKDFKSVYFSATVLTPSSSPKKRGRKKSKRSRGLYVEYQNLLAHEDGSDRLREHVDVKFVRPQPPLLDTVKGFELDEAVDAFYKDGWWPGVVTQVNEGGERYTVTFHNPPDELEFGISELRAHWDWVKGSWVRPHKQSITGLMFDVGRKVEVSFDRKDSQEAWFPATIIEDMGNGTFSVEYIAENTNNKVRVDSLHIRPCPPLLKDKNFILLEKVDAFFDHGWWSGVITRQLENSRYLVFFKLINCHKEFNQSELRPHMEWKDGKWFTSAQEPSIPFLDDGMCRLHTTENSSASVGSLPVRNSMDEENSSDGKPQLSSKSRKGHSEPLILDNLKLAEATIPVTKRRAQLSDSGGALSQHRKNLKEGNLVRANKKSRRNGSEKEVISGYLSPESVCSMEKSVAQTTLDQSSNHPWEDNVQRKQRNTRTPQNIAGKISSTISSLGKSSAQVPTVEQLEIGIGEKEPDTAGNTEDVTQNGIEKLENGLPVVICLPCAETGSLEPVVSGAKKRQPSKKRTSIGIDDQKQVVNDSTVQKIKDDKQLGVGEGSEKRKRGRPKKNLAESTEPLMTRDAEHRNISSRNSNRKDDTHGSEAVVFGMEASVSNHENTTADQENTTANLENTTANQEKIANSQFTPRKRKARVPKQILASEHQKDNLAESVRPEVSHSWKRGRKPISSGKISIKVRDLVGASGDKLELVKHTVEVEKAIELPNSEFDNEPLSKWIEGMHMSSAIDVSTVPCTVNGDNKGNSGVLGEVSEKQPENGKQSSCLVDRGDIAPTEPQSLPSVISTVAVVLDEATQKQSNGGTHAVLLVDKVSTVASEPQSLPSVEEMTTVYLLNQDGEKQVENEARATAMPDNGSLISQPERCVEKTVDIVLDDDNGKQTENGTTLTPASINLPFVKNTILWKTIESMEVFKKMPQMPHFLPLEKFKESSREGLAIGYMVTFSSLVERTSRLQINDPISSIVDIKESLAELKKHGFEISVVEDCINQLLDVKNMEEKHVNEVTTIDKEITEQNREKSRIESEIEEIDKQILILQEKLSLSKSAKEKQEEEIAFKLVRRREAEDSIKNMKSDFNGIASSIL